MEPLPNEEASKLLIAAAATIRPHWKKRKQIEKLAELFANGDKPVLGLPHVTSEIFPGESIYNATRHWRDLKYHGNKILRAAAEPIEMVSTATTAPIAYRFCWIARAIPTNTESVEPMDTALEPEPADRIEVEPTRNIARLIAPWQTDLINRVESMPPNSILIIQRLADTKYHIPRLQVGKVKKLDRIR